MSRKAKGSGGKGVTQRKITGGMSRLELSEEVERMLVDLMVRLDGDDAAGDIASMRQELEEEAVEDRESESGEDSEESSDGEEAVDPPAKTIDKELLVRKMIRDDRRQSREEALVRLESRGKSGGRSAESLLRVEVTESASPGSAQLRLQLHCEGKSGLSKLLVVGRSSSLDDVIAAARSKFNVGKKFNVLYKADDKTVLDPSSLALLPGEMSLVLATKAPPPTKSDETGRDTTEDKAEHTKVVAPAESKTVKRPAWSAVDVMRAEAAKSALNTSPRCDDPELSQRMKSEMLERMDHPDYQRLLSDRQALPIYQMRDELLQSIASNQVVVVSGATGSGESKSIAVVDHFFRQNHTASKLFAGGHGAQRQGFSSLYYLHSTSTHCRHVGS